jgi:DNA invertase Pin-like site-specific DNA recombinase
VLARFREEGESAKTADRTELQKLLKFCRTNKGRVQFAVVFNLTRFARDKYDHFALRAHLKSLGISLPSASNLWVQSSFAQKQRLQQVFFPDGIRFDGKRLVGTGTTLPGFQLLEPNFG